MKGLADVVLQLCIIPRPDSGAGTGSIPRADAVPNRDVSVPFCRYINLCFAPGSSLQPGAFQKPTKTFCKNCWSPQIFVAMVSSWFPSNGSTGEPSGGQRPHSQPTADRGWFITISHFSLSLCVV